MADTALALPPSSVLARVGAPEERQYLISILAETLGIPAKDSERADVMAILGMAVQRTSQYGWLPGIHMHCQKFETSDSRKRRQNNPAAAPEYTYTLVDGEKAWKDSGTRWRITYGVNWTYNRKAMTPQELLAHARQMGFGGELPGLAFGMWSRIILIGTDDPKDPDNPLFSSGVFLGKRKVGNSWYDEDLPTQVSSRDVAIRRADKRAMMQSSLSLLPVDELAPAARMENLSHHLRQEAQVHRDPSTITSPAAAYVVEEDGEVLWATDPTPPPAPAAARLENAARSKTDAVDVDFSRKKQASPPPEEADEGTWAEKTEEPPVAARIAPDAPPAGGNGRCPDCNAPAGKAHATSCPQRATPPAATPAAARAEIDARPAPPADARPTVNEDGVIESEYDVYASLLNDPDLHLTAEVSAKLSAFQQLHRESEKMISEGQFNLLRVLTKSIFGGDEDNEHLMLLSCLCGSAIDGEQRPGNKLAFVGTWLKDPNKYNDEVALLFEIMSICRSARAQLEE